MCLHHILLQPFTFLSRLLLIFTLLQPSFDDLRSMLANSVMLRFRPIAPKPPAGEAAPSTAEDAISGTGRRVKRKYVRVRGLQSRRSTKKKLSGCCKPPSPPPPPLEGGAVTLQLLGERFEGEEKSCGDITEWKTDLTVECGGGAVGLGGGGSVIETLMIVEGVTENFAEVRLGFSDEEKIYNLEQDMCPGFVSDGTNSVIWVNKAYEKMVAEEEEEETAVEKKKFVICLVVKGQLPFCPSFVCSLRVTRRKGEGQKWNKMVPCDVWRMGFGGFAWKLDVNTALSLGY